MPGPFLHALNVTFGECDPAGVVYYPRYFDWFHRAMEAWFGEGLGRPYAQVLRELGFPSVRAEADFKAPCRMGELVGVELTVGRLGNASVELLLRVRGPDGTLRATGRVVVVVVAMDPGGPQHFRLRPLPAELRQSMARWSSDG